MRKIIIAIDGPSGSGKSTTAKNIAKELGIEYIDTGAMYRAAALQAKLKNVPIEENAVSEMLDNTDIDFMDGEIFLDGREVDDQIRNLEISALASQISQLASCRTKLVQIQRRIAKAKSVVMDGRDICTNVLPEAEFKFYMTASIDVRAERRFKELQENGHNVSLDEVKADIEKRDHEDMTRELNPLVKADDAVEISTDGHTVEEILTTRPARPDKKRFRVSDRLYESACRYAEAFLFFMFMRKLSCLQSEKKADRREAYIRWMNQPLPSFGSNHVDFGGIIIPASATLMISPTDTG